MTTSPYSQDLRERVIKFLESGNTQILAAQVFSLNLSTVNRWYLRYRREGNCNARKRLGAKIKIDHKGLEKYITHKPDAKLRDLSLLFGVSVWSIHYWLGKLGFSYKKKPSPMWKRIKESEMSTKKL